MEPCQGRIHVRWELDVDSQGPDGTPQTRKGQRFVRRIAQWHCEPMRQSQESCHRVDMEDRWT